MRSLIVVGGGEHACVVLEAARSQPDLWDVIGFVDPEADTLVARRFGVPHLGDDAEAPLGRSNAHFIIGLGSTPEKRRAIVGRFGSGTLWAVVVHARAWVSPTATIADGTFVSANAVVNSGAMIGPHVIVNTGALIEHDVTLGGFTHVAPAAAIGGGAAIGRDVHVGLGASVRDHIRVGDGAFIAMGAVVAKDLGNEERVRGVPARSVRASTHAKKSASSTKRARE